MRLNVLALSCLFPNSQQPSYGIFVLNRLKAVSRACAVKVIAPVPVYALFDRALRGGKGGAVVPFQEEIQQLEVHHPRFRVIPRFCKWVDALTYLLSVRRMLPRVADPAFTPDLIDVHWTYPDIVTGYWLARRRGCKLLVTVRGKEALYPGERSVRRWMLRHCLRRADAVITLSDELKQLVVEFGVPPGRVRTILNGVDRSRFFSRPGVECRQRLGIPADARVLISVGSLVERKGHHELIKVMPELTRSHPGVRLYIIGGRGPEGDMSATLRSMIAERGLTNVYLIDKVDHAALADWYGAADVFCLATKGEGCPNVVLEALACGAPVVATDVGAIRELVSDGVNGFVVGAGSAAELGPAIERALRHNWDRAHIAEDMDRWGWAKCADQVIETYRSVLQARDPQRATGNLT